MGLQGTRGSGQKNPCRDFDQKGLRLSPEGGWDPEGLSVLGEWTTLNWIPSCLLVTWPRATGGGSCAHSRPPCLPGTPWAQLQAEGIDGVGMHTWRPAAVVMAHPTCPFDSPEPPLPCLESARQRNQVFSQANPCYLGRALPPTKSLLFPGPWGLWAKDWAEAIWALAAWPGAPSLLLPSSSLPLSFPAALAQLYLLQVSKANG